MKIIDKIKAKSADLFGQPTVSIAFLGDSVTQGCFEVFCPQDHVIDTVFESHNAYHAKLHRILSNLYSNVPFHFINAGISGGTAGNGAARLERDVLRYSPDLCVVCFGLNDSCNLSDQALDDYGAALTEIFTRLQQAGVEAILMTPNMMCTKVFPDFEKPILTQVAQSVQQVQTSGRLAAFVDCAKNVARSHNVPICDCYAKWEQLAAAGVDTDRLLSNHINHPTREMHELFANALMETMLQ
ncbi:MAG: GDSL family lipase [Clostridia bacterium]|nr:GDSL family lipase [Clostridia bacterium]